MNLINIEIKAYINDYQKTLELITKLCPDPVSIEKQTDTFFNTEKGRLKLREEHTKAALIYYDRSDSIEPSQSDIKISFTNEPDTLKAVLNNSLGIRGIVKKKRNLYLYDQTRIHLDSVEKLGNFIELEVVLKEGQSAEEGKMIAQELKQKLNISDSNLIDCAYIDLLERNL